MTMASFPQVPCHLPWGSSWTPALPSLPTSDAAANTPESIPGLVPSRPRTWPPALSLSCRISRPPNLSSFRLCLFSCCHHRPSLRHLHPIFSLPSVLSSRGTHLRIEFPSSLHSLWPCVVSLVPSRRHLPSLPLFLDAFPWECRSLALPSVGHWDATAAGAWLPRILEAPAHIALFRKDLQATRSRVHACTSSFFFPFSCLHSTCRVRSPALLTDSCLLSYQTGKGPSVTPFF